MQLKSYALMALHLNLNNHVWLVTTGLVSSAQALDFYLKSLEYSLDPN